MRIRTAIVAGLERTCGFLDDIPGYRWEDGRPRFWRHAQYGCHPFRLAYLSAKLDDRWGTGAWDKAAKKARARRADRSV